MARSVADMLNGQAVGGKRGDRYRDDVWTMKYLPKFKWNMLTEQLRESYLFSLFSPSPLCFRQLELKRAMLLSRP